MHLSSNFKASIWSLSGISFWMLDPAVVLPFLALLRVEHLVYETTDVYLIILWPPSGWPPSGSYLEFLSWMHGNLRPYSLFLLSDIVEPPLVHLTSDLFSFISSWILCPAAVLPFLAVLQGGTPFGALKQRVYLIILLPPSALLLHFFLTAITSGRAPFSCSLTRWNTLWCIKQQAFIW